jgi:outer membrane protein assembly factor BamE
MAASALQVRYHRGALSRNALFTHNVFTMLIFNDLVRTPQRLFAALICSAALALGSSGCVYRVPIQQGNLLETKDIEQVAVGMTQAQVRYVLGTPMVVDPFSKDRWDYVYYLKKGQMRTPEQRHFVVYFENGTVSRIVHSDGNLEKAKSPS